MHHRWRSVLAASLVTVMFALPACTSSSPGERGDAELPAAADGQIQNLRVALGAGVRSLDPMKAFDGVSLLVNNHLYESLLAFDASGQLVGLLAESWEETSPTTYVYTVRDGVRFWDGAPLTAEDVAYSLERQLDPANASELLRLLGNVAGVDVTGDREVTVTLRKADPSWQYNPVIAWPIVQKAHTEANATDLGSPSNPAMGTGPYTVETHSSATGTTIVRNNDYWGSEHAVQRVEFSVINDPEARRLAAQSGAIDVTWDAPLSQSDRWDSIDGFNMVYPPTPITTFFSFDTQNKPFDDVHFRRAISYAVDREGLAQAIFNSRAVPTSSIVTPMMWGDSADETTVNQCYDAMPDYSFDLDKAREELAKSSTPEGAKIKIGVVEGRDEVDIAQTLAQNLKQIGVELEVDTAPYAEWLATLNSGEDLGMQAVRSGAGYPDPYAQSSQMLGDPKADGVLNPSKYSTAETLALLNGDIVSSDPKKRANANCDLLTAAAEDAAYAGVVETPRPFAISDDYTYDGQVSYWVGQTGDWLQHIKPAAG